MPVLLLAAGLAGGVVLCKAAERGVKMLTEEGGVFNIKTHRKPKKRKGTIFFRIFGV